MEKLLENEVVTGPSAGAFSACCRRAGIANTPQRRLIYQALAESKDHPTAEVVHARVLEQLPRVSLATVYRNLKLFARVGIIDEVATGSSYARYDANRERHHHLICKRCGSVADYYSEQFDGLGSSGVDAGGFEVHDLKVNVFGVCAACHVGAGQDDNTQSNG